MLTSEVYYLKSSRRPGRWWFAILECGKLGQILGRLKVHRCRNKKEARKLAALALTYERSIRSAQSM